jgi:uncharacterized membrane protein YesL
MNNRSENFFFRWASKLGDFCGLSVVWMLMCIPIITAIPASVAMYSSIVNCVHGNEEGSVRWFFRSFKKELIRGLALGALWLVIVAMLAVALIFLIGQESQFGKIFSIVYMGSTLIPASIMAWLIPTQARFAYSFGDLHKAAAYYAIAHLPTTALLLLIVILGVALTLCLPILVIVMPAIIVTIQCWLIEKVFVKYMDEDEETDE